MALDCTTVNFANIPGPETQDGNNLLDIANEGGLHYFQLKLHATYGSIAKFYLDKNTPILSINDPMLIQQTAHIANRPRKLFEFLEPLIGDEQVLPPDMAKSRRKFITNHLGTNNFLKNFTPNFNKMTQALCEQWSGDCKNNKEIFLQKDLTMLSLNAATTIATGLNFNDSLHDISNAFEIVLGEYIARQYQLPSELSDEQRKIKSDDALSFLKGTVHELLEKHQLSEKNDEEDFIDALIQYEKDSETCCHIILAVMLAGYHTTGLSISWVLYCLALYPDIAEKVYAEIDNIDFNDDFITIAHNFPYLDKVIHETLRRYTVAPIAARELPETLNLNGFEIPAGTTLFYPIWAIHMNPELWPEPESFNPERFNHENIQARHKFAYVPFGVQARSCTGQKLAMFEMRFVLVTLLKKFRFELVSQQPPELIERFVLWAKDDIPIRCHLRG